MKTIVTFRFNAVVNAVKTCLKAGDSHLINYASSF